MSPDSSHKKDGFRPKDLLAQQGLALIIIIFFLADGATKLLRNNYAEFYNLSAVVKVVFMIFAAYIAIRNLTEYRKRIFGLIGALIIIYLLGTAATNSWQPEISHFTKNAVFLGRFLLVFFLLLYIQDPYKINVGPILEKVFKGVIAVNSALILFSAIFGWKLFETWMGSRYGYSGLFAASSMGSYFYALAITYTLSRYRRTRKGLPLLVLSCLAAFFVGTKALWLFMVLSLLHCVFADRLYLKKWFLLGTAALTGLSLVFFNKLKAIVLANDVLYKVYREEGLLTMLSSYRNKNIVYVYDNLVAESWQWTNYLLGGTDFTEFRIEFAFLDLFLFFGIVGACLYLFFYFTKVLRLNEFFVFERVQLVFVLGIALLSGTFLNNGVVPIYLLVVIMLIQKSRWTS